MNILFLFYAPMLPYVGGIQRVSENLAKEMTARGHKVCFLCINHEDKDVDYIYPVPQFFLDESLEKQAYIESYYQILKKNSVDVVINQEPQADLLNLLANTPKDIRKVTCYHTLPFLSEGKTRLIMKYYKSKDLKTFLYRAICRLFPKYHTRKLSRQERLILDRALAVSDCLCLESEKYFPRIKKKMPYIDDSQLIAVGNPCSLPFLGQKYNYKEKIVLWVGRQSNTPKNVPAFIDLWICFQKRNPEWKAYIIGVGQDWEFNKNYAEKRKAKNVFFLGRVKDISLYYQKATFFMMTSMYEGFPMVLLEAMSNACIPCLYDTFESLHDIVEDGNSGIIASPYNKDEMIGKMEHVITSSVLASEMRQSALRKSRCFTVDKITDKWESILAELCK